MDGTLPGGGGQGGLNVRAYAKVNLVLEVLGKRPDGYHEIASIMQTIDLYDDLSFTLSDELVIDCGDPVMQGDGNLIIKAARALQLHTGVKRGAVIGLRKMIPSSAGLGGGSSNAAATLEALNMLWETGLDRGELSVIAGALGSDVPFFLNGGTCLAEGRGEVVTPLADAGKAWYVIFSPPVTVPPNKTATLYDMLGKQHLTDGSKARGLADDIKAGRKDVRLYFNCFDQVARYAYPGLEAYMAKMELCAPLAGLAGSGPALYSIFDTAERAQDAGRILAAEGGETFVVSSVDRHGTGH